MNKTGVNKMKTTKIEAGIYQVDTNNRKFIIEIIETMFGNEWQLTETTGDMNEVHDIYPTLKMAKESLGRI